MTARKLSTVLMWIAISMLLSIAQVSIVNAANLTVDAGAVNNNISVREVISITDIVKPHAINDAKEVFSKPGSFYIEPVRWSPDGGRVFMLARTTWSQYEEVSGIYVMNADGTGLRKIISSKKIDSKGAWISDITWTQDGGKIFFQLSQSKGALLAVVNPDGTGLQVIGTNLSDMESILSFLPDAGWWQRNPQWSPDMTKMAFEFEKEATLNTDIYIADADGSNPRELHSGISNNRPVWSHDSEKILFSTIGEQSSLIKINADGTDIKYLSNASKFMSYQWSPDDRKILYISSKEMNGKELFDIYTVNADGTENTKIIGGESINNPSWNSDGSKILFEKASYENGVNRVNIYTSDADGRNLKTVSRYDWELNGKEIIYSDKYNLYSMNPDGTGKTLLALTGWGEFLQRPVYAWNPSNDKIVFSAIIDPVTGKQVDFDTFWARKEYYEAHIFLSNPDGAERAQLTSKEPYNVITGGWSPDGSRLIVASSHDIEMRASNVSIIKLSGYDEVMSIYAPGSIKQGDSAFIEVKSMSKPVENAVISLNDKKIGATNAKGILEYSFKETGNYRLSAVKQGFRTASKPITIQESPSGQSSSEPTLTAATPKAPGFGATLAIAILSTIYFIKRRYN